MRIMSLRNLLNSARWGHHEETVEVSEYENRYFSRWWKNLRVTSILGKHKWASIKS